MQIELTIQYVNPPKTGKRFGSIKSSEGDTYWGSGQTINQFRQGEVCQIEYTESTGQDGMVWKRISKKLAGMAQPQKVIPQVRAQTNPRDQKQIFITALLKETVTPTDTKTMLIARAQMLAEVYEHLFGPQKKQETESALDDQIPDGPPDYPEEGNWEREP